MIRFFADRAPISDPADFVGHRGTAHILLSYLAAGQTCNLFGEPRIGRSSLLSFIAHPRGAQAEDALWPFGEDLVLFVPVHLERLSARDPADFWRYLLDRLRARAEEASLGGRTGGASRDAGRNGIDVYSLGIALDEALSALPCTVVFLLDDFQGLVQNLARDAVQAITGRIRTMANPDMNVRFVLSTVDDLRTVMRRAGLVGSAASPLTNVTLTVRLGLLSEAEARHLLVDAGSNREAAGLSEADVDGLVSLAGPHPDLLKVAAFSRLSQGSLEAARAALRVERGDLMGMWFDRLQTRRGDDLLALLDMPGTMVDIAQGRPPRDLNAATELAERGLVVGGEGQWSVFSSAFADYLREQVAGPPPTSQSPWPLARVVSDGAPSSGVQRDLRFSPEPHIVLRGRVVPLTPFEAALYADLSSHVGQTRDRETLRRVIWGESTPTTADEAKRAADRLDQIVKRLRAKIEVDQNLPRLLVTVRGQGYMLRELPST